MITQNVIPTKVGIDRYVIEIDDNELTRLVYKHGQVNIKIGAPVKSGTEAQNKAMHSLLTEYYKTGLHSAPEGSTLTVFKEYMKYLYGVSKKIVIDGKELVSLKSWSSYTMRERKDFIDGLISEIHQAGAYAESSKIQEIIKGMEKVC